jgi:hypothetical protein
MVTDHGGDRAASDALASKLRRYFAAADALRVLQTRVPNRYSARDHFAELARQSELVNRLECELRELAKEGA